MILIKNALAVEMDPPRIRENLNILIDGKTIRAVGSGADFPAGAGSEKTVIDAAGAPVFPGLVCSHNHFYSGLARGIMASIGPTPDFVSTLKNLWWRMDRALDEESLYYSGLICSLEAVKAGTTAVIDHHAGPSCIEGSLAVLKKGFEKAGLRGATCYEVTDRNGLAEMRRGVEENLSFARLVDREKREGTGPGLVEAHMGGHAPNTLPPEALELLARAVRDSGRGFHCHVAEDRYDVSHSHAFYGKDLLFRLDEAGLLDEKTLIIHGVHLSSGEIDLLNRRDAFLVHNVRSNMNNHVGYMAGLKEVKNLALGTDGIGSDMLEEFKFACFKHKDEGGSFWPGDFLKALAAGNRILDRVFGSAGGASFGRLEPGCPADLVVTDYRPPTPLVPENIGGHLAFGMGSGSVRTVIINGKAVYTDRQFPFDLEEIYARAREEAAKMWKRMDAIAP